MYLLGTIAIALCSGDGSSDILSFGLMCVRRRELRLCSALLVATKLLSLLFSDTRTAYEAVRAGRNFMNVLL